MEDSKMEDVAKADEPAADADAEPTKQYLLDRIATSDGFKTASRRATASRTPRRTRRRTRPPPPPPRTRRPQKKRRPARTRRRRSGGDLYW